ncbi:DegV family protein [Lacticaseibacillus manihotivorans]|jgi:DegV family protein with EDD domain|uniref:DegV family protein n=2 Tax=Lacticaseibacillus manihotivorans TaxID=88233 RepID=A0A0R1QHD1_9LACO|nr:DegV family protein [Lacticaseibacillus manihotivorans]KRL43953.1 DegV family protein [Lacticaseibacillus manihotivorans DSM 13343 = JCM 12514]QFQ91290.1 DegV family EDD domain-containing protein [Lacticaseibacillus manihotivorans]
MAKIKLVTDSSIQLTPEEVARYDIRVVPLTIMIDSTVYIDGETITRSEFMEKMAEAKALPKTSQPAPGTFLDVFNDLTADGSQVLCVNMLQAISGTVNSARQAAELSDGDVTVVDCDFTDRAMAFQVIEAAKAIEAGADMDGVLARMTEVREHTILQMGVSTLDNLVKGGRLSKAAGVVGSLLNIKVVLQVADGELKVMQKGRGLKTLHRFVDGFVEKLQGLENLKEVGISFAGGEAYAQEIGNKIKAVLPNLPVLVRPTDPVIATHTGDGAFAIMCYTD